MGEEGMGGGMPGDLFLKVNIKKPLIEQIKGLFGSFRK